MMEGITVLAETMAYCYPETCGIIIITCFIIGLFAFMFAFISSGDSILTGIFSSILALCAIVGAGTIVYGEFNEIPDYVKYKVLIEDEVNLNDFLNKYEILDQEGKIYTIKEIEVDEE